MSIKLDVLDVDRADEIIDDAVDVLARAKRFIPQVMVEMPVIPGTGKAMRRLQIVLIKSARSASTFLSSATPWELGTSSSAAAFR